MDLLNFFGNFTARTVKNNETYHLQDWEVLQNLTISKTSLHALQSTRGHAHEGLEEVYLFTGTPGQEGYMEVGDEKIPVHSGCVVAIPAGKFHRVHNTGNIPLHFIAIFQKYDREA